MIPRWMARSPWIIHRMLHRIRQYRSLHAVLVTLLALSWLVALAAGVQARASLALGLLPPDVCSSTPGGHGAHGPGQEAPAGHAHHQDPDCLMCVALAAPPATVLAVSKPPAPIALPARKCQTAAAWVWRAMAPLPARGPPATRYV